MLGNYDDTMMMKRKNSFFSWSLSLTLTHSHCLSEEDDEGTQTVWLQFGEEENLNQNKSILTKLEPVYRSNLTQHKK